MNNRRSSPYRPVSRSLSKASLGGSPGPSGNSSSSSPYALSFEVGDCVEVSKSRAAVIKYIGPLQESRGVWYGIEFVDGSVGSHNGVYKNVFYFKGADKRCEFMHRGDIRRKLTFRSNSTRDIGLHHDHRHRHELHDHSRSATMRRLGSSSPRDHQITPTLPLPEPVISSAITLFLRCQCFADPVPIELQLNENEVTLKELKLKIVEECKNRTSLSVFSEHEHDELGVADKVDIYRLTMMRSSNWNDSHSPPRSVRVNSLNVQSGNMAHCILKRNAECFKKLALSANPHRNGNHTLSHSHGRNREEAENAPLRYYRVGDGETLYVLFPISVSIKVLFQKTLFSKMGSLSHSLSAYGRGSRLQSASSLQSAYSNEDKLERTESDDAQYLHHHTLSAPLCGKFEELYRALMESTDIGNVNCIKLLSTNFIYNKSMMIEKFVYNTVDEEAECVEHGDASSGGNSSSNGDRKELYLYFIHLYDASDSGHKRHRTRSRNYSTSSTLSAYSTANSAHSGYGGPSASSSLSPAKLAGPERLSALKTSHFTMNSSGSAYSSYSAYGGHRSPYGLGGGGGGLSSNSGLSGGGQHIANQRSAAYSKVLLNFVTAKKSESYTILDRNQTVKELRAAISAKFKTECDRIKVGNERMSDFKAVREYNLGQNEILHIFDESMLTIFVQQSGHGHGQAVEMKLNRKLTVQHIKYQISDILRSHIHALSVPSALSIDWLTVH